MAAKSFRQALLEQLDHLPEERLREVLLFVNFLLYSQQASSAQTSEETLEMSGDDTKDSLAEFIGAAAHDSIAQSLNEAVYLSEAALAKDWLKPEEEAAWRDL